MVSLGLRFVIKGILFLVATRGSVIICKIRRYQNVFKIETGFFSATLHQLENNTHNSCDDSLYEALTLILAVWAVVRD